MKNFAMYILPPAKVGQNFRLKTKLPKKLGQQFPSLAHANKKPIPVD